MSLSGYDYEPEVGGGGLFLQLKEKGQQVEIRLCSTPVRELKIWKAGDSKPVEQEKVAQLTPDRLDQIKTTLGTDGKPKYRLSEQFSWVVIDRADGQAKLFSAPVSVYRKIKDYGLNEKWGDPSHYDLAITRTEEPGNNYYQLTPDPNKSELSEEEVTAARAVDVFSLNPYARPTGSAFLVAGQEVQFAAVSDSDALDADAL